MKIVKIIRRFIIPKTLVSLIYYLKFNAIVSTKAEVELSPLLEIGKKTYISSFCKIKANDGLLSIGSSVAIGSGCFISSDIGGVKIGNYCLISPNVSIIGSNYRYDELEKPICKQGQSSKGIYIGDNVWIGAGSVVLDGAKIGEGTIVSPNSVISGAIPINSIVQGNPGKVVFVRR